MHPDTGGGRPHPDDRHEPTATTAPGAVADLLAQCVPLRDRAYGGRPAWGWCPACAPFTATQVAVLRAAVGVLGGFFGSRYHPECAQSLLRAWRARR